MDVDNATMKVDWFEARRQYREYRAAVKLGKATEDDAQLLAALGAIVRGRKVLDINLAIQDAGVDREGMPALAVARAHWHYVHTWVYDGQFVFSRGPRRWSTAGDRQTFTHNVHVRLPLERSASLEGKAQVPLIPPQYRPTGNISGYHILFEAEWQRVPPKDPILLRKIGGPFYVVLAHWNLSPLEQAVLRAKL